MHPYSPVNQSQELFSRLADLAHQYHLIAIYAFGSRAKEIIARLEGKPDEVQYLDSDLDIGVLPALHHHLPIDDITSLAQTLEVLFGVPRVDLIILPKAPPFLALDVVRGELLYASDLDVEAEYQLCVLARAGDLAGWELERRQMILSGEAF